MCCRCRLSLQPPALLQTAWGWIVATGGDNRELCRDDGGELATRPLRRAHPAALSLHFNQHQVVGKRNVCRHIDSRAVSAVGKGRFRASIGPLGSVEQVESACLWDVRASVRRVLVRKRGCPAVGGRAKRRAGSAPESVARVAALAAKAIGHHPPRHAPSAAARRPEARATSSGQRQRVSVAWASSSAAFA